MHAAPTKTITIQIMEQNVLCRSWKKVVIIAIIFLFVKKHHKSIWHSLQANNKVQNEVTWTHVRMSSKWWSVAKILMEDCAKSSNIKYVPLCLNILKPKRMEMVSLQPKPIMTLEILAFSFSMCCIYTVYTLLLGFCVFK